MLRILVFLIFFATGANAVTTVHPNLTIGAPGMRFDNKYLGKVYPLGTTGDFTEIFSVTSNFDIARPLIFFQRCYQCSFHPGLTPQTLTRADGSLFGHHDLINPGETLTLTALVKNPSGNIYRKSSQNSFLIGPLIALPIPTSGMMILSAFGLLGWGARRKAKTYLKAA